VIVLDTDVLTLIQRRQGGLYTRLVRRLDECGEPVYVTIVTIEEQMRGWLGHISKARSADKWVDAYRKLQRFTESLPERPILGFAEDAASILSRLRKARVRIGTMDLRIAAIALANSATVITRNVSDFNRVPNLRVEDWTTIDQL
jgi:tRNA(fMet)-specific endonuclease VapC